MPGLCGEKGRRRGKKRFAGDMLISLGILGQVRWSSNITPRSSLRCDGASARRWGQALPRGVGMTVQKHVSCCCQKAYTLRCCHAHSFAVLLCQHAGCPGKRDPTFAQSLAEVLVAAHQRHLMLTALLLLTLAVLLLAFTWQQLILKLCPVKNTIIRKSIFAAKKNINHKTQASPCLSPRQASYPILPKQPPAQTPERLRH